MGGSRPADLGGNWPLGRVFVDLELQAHLRILMVGNRDDAMVDQQDSWDLHSYELDATVQTYGDLEHVSPPGESVALRALRRWPKRVMLSSGQRLI